MLIPYTLEPPPPLPPLDDPWEETPFELLAGRRVTREGDLVWFGEGVTVEALAVLGPLELTDRRIVALEEPLFVWEVEAAGEVQMMCDLLFEADLVRYERSDDGARLWLGGGDPAEELLVTCYGGAVEVTDEGERLRLHAQGRDRMRLVMVAAWSEADRDRTLRALMRKGVGGVVAQHLRHAQMIAALGAALTTPDPQVNDRFEFDKRDLDATLREWRVGSRALVEPYLDGITLLTLGLREAVRDTLRGPLEDVEVRRLFAAYAAWVGADDFVRRHWRRVEEAMRSADPSDHQEDAASELIPVAEALGDHAAVATLEAIIGSAVHPPRVRPWSDVDTPLDRWRITPGALDGTVKLEPELPPEWPEMTLERLRIGETSLDVRVRRRPGGVAVKVRVTRGPPIVVQLAPRLSFEPTGILVNGEQLVGSTVRLTVEQEIEGVWIQ